MKGDLIEHVNRTIEIKQYYDCIGRFHKLYKKEKKSRLNTDTIKGYDVWKEQTRDTLKNLIGLNQMEACNLDANTIEVVELEDGIKREKVVIQVEPEVYMPFYILIPSKRDVSNTCYLALPGHMGAGKYAVAGCYDIPVVADQIKVFQYDYGMQLAKLGHVVFCPDIRGFGERREAALQTDNESDFINGTCFHLAHMAEPLGQTVIGMHVWDMMKLLDYVSERAEWNFEKIGCVGFSGGGMITLWLTALDDRIQKACISGYFYGYEDSLLELNGNCSCNYVPHLWEHVDMGDMGALLAPRNIVIQSAREDHLNGKRGLQNVYEQLDIMKKAYRIFEKEDGVYHDIREGGHCFHKEVLNLFEELE